MEDRDGEDVTVLGPAPLVRNDDNGSLRLQPEGLEILRQARAPVHIVFAIGGSRCGKSTTSNALAFASEGSEARGFTTGDSFDAVTEGVDVAARHIPGGGSLIVADCEGAFHACASSQSARGFGTLGLLAYRMSTALMHVSMGSIDERDIEAIGFLAAHGISTYELGDTAVEAKEPEAEDSDQSLSPSCAPSLLLLINGARFELTDAVAKRLLRVPEDGLDTSRSSARAAIARGFQNETALEALPACEHASYWPKVEALRRRILGVAPLKLASGQPAVGADVVERISHVVAGLNGEEPSAVLAREPQAATEALYRSMHLDPLIEEMCRRFAASGAGEQRASEGILKTEVPASPTKCAFTDMLVEFDRRTAWLAGETGGVPLIRDSVVSEVRTRLAARLSGIREALARGRQQGAQARPVRNRSRPTSLGGGSCISPAGADKENVSPSTGTPSNGKKSLHLLESSFKEVESQFEDLVASTEQELSEMQAAFLATQDEIVRTSQRREDVECKALAAVNNVQDRFQCHLRELAEARVRRASTEATRCSTISAELEGELLALGQQLPDLLAQGSSQLAEIRDGLEAQRLQRQEAGNVAARTLEGRLKTLREDIGSQASALAQLREAASTRWQEDMQEFSNHLEEERSQRKSSQAALLEVVNRLRASLEASAEVTEHPPAKSLFRAPRTPTKRSEGGVCTPAAPTALPGQEANRSCPALWGASLSTPLNTSTCSGTSGTPRRSALPAPPVANRDC